MSSDILQQYITFLKVNPQTEFDDRQLRSQVQDLQSQLQAATSSRAECSSQAESALAHLKQQNSELQTQLQAAARAWADKTRAHKQALAKAQQGEEKAAGEAQRLAGLLQEAEQVCAENLHRCMR